jgi:hypothetical protein
MAMRTRCFETRKERLQLNYQTLMRNRIDAEKPLQVQQKSEQYRIYREVSAMWRALMKWTKQAGRARLRKATVSLEHHGSDSFARHYKSLAPSQKRLSSRHRLAGRRRRPHPPDNCHLGLLISRRFQIMATRAS